MNIPNLISYISDKIEEFRLDGKVPSYMGVTIEVLNRFNEEMSKARGVVVDMRLEDFIGVPVVPMSGDFMPKDGVYLHHREEQ